MSTLVDNIRRIVRLPGGARHQIRKGNRARDVKDFAGAAAFYAQALRKTPNNGAIHIQAGHMFKDSGDLPMAEQHYLHALALNPDDSDAHLQLGHLYKNTGRPQRAYAHFLRLSEIEPGWPIQELEDVRHKANVFDTLGEASSYQVTEDVMRNSGLIDPEWYSVTYSDIGTADSIQHFIDHGRFELRRPGPGFDPHWYLRTYPQVLRSKLDPFTHYLAIGRTDGLKPVGPGIYQQWIAAYDVLGDSDRKAIEAHIVDTALIGPSVLVAVNAVTAASLAQAITGLREQWLKPRRVHLCLAADCSSKVRNTIRALVGSDDLFRTVDVIHSIDDLMDDEQVVLMDAAVELRKHALYMLTQAATSGTILVYADHDRIDDERMRYGPVFKPAASPELLRQTDYIGACGLLSAGTVTEHTAQQLVLGDWSVADILRSAGLSVKRTAVAHVPFVLYHDHAERDAPVSPRGPRLTDADLPTVTIIIPTRDRLDLLCPCIESLRRETDYPLDRLDIVVVDNGSVDDETIDWLASREAIGELRIIHAPIPFNYPILNNIAAQTSTADVLILLNNDTEVQDPDWLRGLVGYVMQPDVGAVGPMLLYDDGTIQHAGVVLSVGGVAAHAHCGIVHDAPGALGFAQRTREVAAVTGACLAMRRDVFEQIGGLDPGLPVAFNDVMLCLTAIDHGYRNLYVHDVWVRHYESKTRGRDDTLEKVKVFNREARYAREKSPDLFRDDPFYSPNLSFNLADMYKPAFPPRTRRPWQPYMRIGQPMRVLLLSSTIDTRNEIGSTVALQARYLTEQGYEVIIGTPYSTLSGSAANSYHRMIEDSRDAASYAVEVSCDVIVAHTPNYGEVSRWLGVYPPVVLHYHGMPSEVACGVAGHPFQQEGRLLALPFVSHVIAGSSDAAAELALSAATILPLGNDRLGIWSSEFMPLRESVRHSRGWTDRTVILISITTEQPDSGMFRELGALIREFEARAVALVILVPPGHSVSDLPAGITSVMPADLSERRSVMAGADVFWTLGKEGRNLLVTLEAAALGLLIFDPDAIAPARSARATARALASAVEIAGIPDPWVRRPKEQPGWAEVLGRFEKVLLGVHGVITGTADRTGTMLSAEALIDESGLFDLDYYHARHADLEGADGYRHFIDHGHREGRDASRLFDTKWYLEQYPEVRGDLNGAMLDYLRHPKGLRDPNPFFSNRAYLAGLGERDTGGVAPLVHYLQGGAAAGLSIGNAFDADYYCSVYPDVPVSSLPALTHFLTRGFAEGRMATALKPSPINLFDDDAVVQATGKSIAQSLPAPVEAGMINGRASATRFIVATLRERADLRRRFPNAISAGSNGAFAAWLAGEGANELGLSDKAKRHIGAAFISDPGARLRQLRLIRPDMAQRHPLALTPAGSGSLLAWAVQGGLNDERIGLDGLWWFLLSVNEAPAHGLVDTFCFTQAWQLLFPDGLTVFGRRALADWLCSSFGVTGAWTDPTGWPGPFTPAEQIRIAYNARPIWQATHPAAFTGTAEIKALLTWLASPDADLASDAVVWLAQQNQEELVRAATAPGVNMLGHFCYASGLRTSTESLVEGFRRADGNIALRDVWVQEQGDENRHNEYLGLEIHDITIIHTQPEPFFDVAYDRAGLAPRTPRTYRIGYWYWELEEIPPHWQKHADEVDEIWTATKFVGDALRERFDVPVRVIMPGLEHPIFKPLPRSHFGLPENTFLFLFTFHMASIMERKNPIGLIAAFLAGFGKDSTVGLVLKTSFGHLYPLQMNELREAARGLNVIIIDDVFSQAEVLALMDTCDSYVSLHRSEGYGLTMAEAMLLGKPVIATGYSGNLDFMSDETSLLVDFDLVTLDRDYPPYKAGMRWAHASIAHAAECMRKVRDNPEWARALGAKAKVDLEGRMSVKVSGRKMVARIAEIELTRRSGKR